MNKDRIEFAINILHQYKEKPTLINEISTVEEAVWLDDSLQLSIMALQSILDIQEKTGRKWLP